MVDLAPFEHIVYMKDKSFAFVSLASRVPVYDGHEGKLIVHRTEHPGRVWYTIFGSNAALIHGIAIDASEEWVSIAFEVGGVEMGTVLFNVTETKRMREFEGAVSWRQGAYLVRFYSEVSANKAVELLVCYFLSRHDADKVPSVSPDTECEICMMIPTVRSTLPCGHVACRACVIAWSEGIELDCRTCFHISNPL